MAATTNKPGMCQQVTRGWFNAPSAGDQDKDGDFDAVDGWLSEPVEARHPNDRTPRVGYPVSYAGGREGHGHRALYVGNGLIRSTDAPFRGQVGTVELGYPERYWGHRYLGWSETIDGLSIPTDAVVDPEKREPRKGTKLYKALNRLREARNEAKRKGQTEKVVHLNLIIQELLRTPRGN
jgi:hypothetical protein